MAPKKKTPSLGGPGPAVEPAPMAWGDVNEAAESMMKLKLAWLRVVSQCWRDPDYAKKVLSAKPEMIRNEFASYGVALPADVSLQIRQEEGNDHWNPKSQKWHFGTSAELTLYLPHAPKPRPGDPEHSDDAVALAEYEWVGRNYPFSCCC